jgi:hypothetical protein
MATFNLLLGAGVHFLKSKAVLGELAKISESCFSISGVNFL